MILLSVFSSHICCLWTGHCNVYLHLSKLDKQPPVIKSFTEYTITEEICVQNGLLSALPYLGAWLVSTLSGVLADYLIERKVFSVTVVRKLFTLAGKGAFTLRSSLCTVSHLRTCGCILAYNFCMHDCSCVWMSLTGEGIHRIQY